MENGYKEEIEKLLKDTDKINFRIRTLRNDNENLTAQNDKDIKEYQEEMKQVEFKMKDAFSKTGEDKVQTKMGYTTWKIVKKQYVFKDFVIEEIQTAYPETANKYIKTSKTIMKDPLKEALQDGTVVLSTESLVINPEDKKFVYKYTGGNK